MDSTKFPSTSPPLHSVAFVLGVLALCITSMPNLLSTIDGVATIESCTSPRFPEIISRSTLGWIRVFFGSFIGAVSTQRMFGE